MKNPAPWTRRIWDLSSQWPVAANDLKKTVKAAGKGGGSDTIHVWHIYLHLVDFYGKCG